MAELIRHKGIPKDCTIVATSDQHFGARAFHAEAFAAMVERVRSDPSCYWVHNGDALEGKPTKSKHFDPRTLDPRYLTVETQADGFVEAVRPIADKCLYFGYGNHDVYCMPDLDVVRWMCEALGIDHVRGGYQGICDLGFLRIFLYHGRRSMPRGAKDRIQREANQNAWLKRTLEDLAGNCHVMIHGHVHTLHVQPPVEQLALLARGASIRARHFVAPAQTVRTRDPATGKVDVREYIPPESRWFCVSGTMRRSGIFQTGRVRAIDYAEIGGYSPSLIGYQEIRVNDGVVDEIQPVVV